MKKIVLFKTTLTTAAAALPLFLLASPAQSSARITLSAPVTWVDLDLTHVEGRETLDRRIEHSVKRICGSVYGKTLSEQMDTRRCQREAMANAAPQREQVVARAIETRARLALARRR